MTEIKIHSYEDEAAKMLAKYRPKDRFNNDKSKEWFVNTIAGLRELWDSVEGFVYGKYDEVSDSVFKATDGIDEAIDHLIKAYRQE